MRKNDLLIIEITARYLKVLNARYFAGKSAQVLGFSSLKIENTSQENIIKLLVSLTGKRNKKAQVIVVIPRGQVILKNFSLPSRSREELRKMITLQMSTQVPYAKEDIVFDYSILGADSAGFTKILSAVIHKEVVNEFFKIFKAAGIDIDRFVLSSSSIARWFYQRSPEALKDTKSTFAVLSLEADISELCFVNGGQLSYSREIKYGLRDLGGDFEDLFLKDILLTLGAYANEHPGERLEKFYVLASPQNKHPLFEKLRMAKSLDISFLDPRGSLQNIPSSDMGNKDFSSPVVCLGSIEESQRISLDLLPEEIRKSQTTRTRQWQFFKFFILIVLNIGLFSLLFVEEFYKNKFVLNDLKAKSSDMRVRADAVKKKAEQLRQIERYVNPSVAIVDIVYSLYDMVPREVSFQLLAIDKNDTLTLQGIAETRTSVNDLQKNLTNNPLFKDVNLQYATQRRFFEGEITDFKIIASVKRMKEER